MRRWLVLGGTLAALAVGLGIRAYRAPLARVSLPPFGVHPAATPTPDPFEPVPAVPIRGAFLLNEDFEQGAFRWRASGWVELYGHTCGGHWVMHAGKLVPTANVPLEATLRLREPLDLGKARHPMLTYDVLGEATPPTALVLQPEIKLEGGPWQPIGSPAYGRYRSSMTRFADLAAYAGRRVRLGFHLRLVPPYTARHGYYLDNVQVVAPE